MLTHHWPPAGMWRQFILQPVRWLKGDCVCVCGGSDEPQTSAKAAGSSSAQVKHSDEVVPASAGWEENRPFTVVWSLISMFWTTDVFYVKKYTFHSLECLHWQVILTDIMWLYVIVITLSILPVFFLNFDKLLWRRFPRWPADQMDGGKSILNFIFSYYRKLTFHDLIHEPTMYSRWSHEDGRVFFNSQFQGPTWWNIISLC